MANLLNVTQQASSNKASPAEKPVKLEAKELKDLFQKQLAENLSSEVSVDKNVEELSDLSEVALAAGAVQGAKTPIDLKTAAQNTTVDPKIKKVDLSVLDAGVGIPIQNQLPVNAKVESSKALSAKESIPAVQAALLKKTGVVNEASNQKIDAELASMMAGQEMFELPEEHAFEVDSLNVKPGVSKEASSKLSTADFLNLREISQNSTKPVTSAPSLALTDPNQLAPMQTTAGVVLGMKATQKQKSDEKQNLSTAMSGLASVHTQQQFGKTLDATVSQTAGQKPILSPESLTQIGNQVNLLGQARQDGEIKIRLRPDHLGELQMSVRTQGQNVSVQIKAENNEAKKIIEDSLGALREHLSMQNLSLASIDVVTQPTAHSNLEQTQMRFDANQNFNQSTQQGERNGSQDGSSQSGREFFGENPSLMKTPAAMIRPKMSDTSRLDLIA